MIALGIILGVLLLILLLPVGVRARYDGDTLVQAVLGPVRLQILPEKPKTRKQLEKEKKKKAEKEQKKAEKKQKAKADKLIYKEPEPKPEQTLTEKIQGLLPFARLAADTLGSVFRRLTVKNLTVHVRFGGNDPEKLADNYAKTMMAIWSMGPILGRAFRIKKSDISVTPDFLSDKTQVEAEIYLRYLVFDLLGIALKYGFRGIKLLQAKKKHEKELMQAQGLLPEKHQVKKVG